MKRTCLLISLLLIGLCATAQEATVVIDKLVAGGLESALKAKNADPKKVTSLTIKSGDLNGTDIHLLRYMGGGDELGQEQSDYALEKLDLTGTNIVTGGGFYIKKDNGTELLTQKDTLSSGMFINCHNLTSLKTPASVTGMDGGQIFAFCRKLQQVTLSAKIKRIPPLAFGYCSDLSQLELPAELEEIGSKAFLVTNSLANITIPESCLVINEGAFFQSGVVKVTLPKALKNLPNGAFSDCAKLESINLPSELDNIGEGAFLRCVKLVLEKVRLSKKGTFGEDSFYAVTVAAYEVDDENPNYSAVDGVLFNKAKTELIKYNIGAKRTAYTVPDGVGKVESNSFYLSILQTINLPSSLKELGERCFKSCAVLESISIPDQIKILPVLAFADCYKLKTVKLPAQLEEMLASCFMRCSNLSKLDFPNKLKHIASEALYFTTIEKLHIPASLTQIDPKALSNIGGCLSITVDKANPAFCDVNGMLFTKDKSELVQVPILAKHSVLTLGEEVSKVWTVAVSTSQEIDRVLFLNPDCKIDRGAFSDSRIKEIVLPANMDTLKEGVLNRCEDLQLCKFPDKLKIIEKGAALGDLLLKTLILPATLEEIQSFAFSNCYGLKQVQCFAKEPPVCSQGVFLEVNCSKLTLYVPSGSKAAYEGADQWKEFGKIVERDTPVSIENANPIASVKLYSVDGGIQVECTEQAQTLYVYKVTGQLVLTKQITGSQFIPLASGMYATRIGSEAKIVNVK